jgi:hypothetical protein|tara:strand:- start:171 stop:440 length:270 start_codon:yes stop_codon:yes gene_type:complete
MKKTMKHRHHFKGIQFYKPLKIDKEQLRKDILIETKKYLQNNKITFLPDSPTGKVPAVHIRDLGAFSDTAEFYYIEEEDDTKNQRLNNL